jgi:hypothetical protein
MSSDIDKCPRQSGERKHKNSSQLRTTPQHIIFLDAQLLLKMSEFSTECRWLLPIIPATWQAELRRIEGQCQPGHIVLETPISKN